MPPQDRQAAAKLQLEEAELSRLFNVADAWQRAKDRATECTKLAREFQKEARKLEKAADQFLEDAKDERKRAKRYYHQLKAQCTSNHGFAATFAAIDDQAKRSKNTS